MEFSYSCSNADLLGNLFLVFNNGRGVIESLSHMYFISEKKTALFRKRNYEPFLHAFSAHSKHFLCFFGFDSNCWFTLAGKDCFSASLGRRSLSSTILSIKWSIIHVRHVIMSWSKIVTDSNNEE